MKQDKFLIGILAFIGLLVVAALVLFFVRGQAEPVPDDTPEGVVYNYILALQEEDYETAYSYLADKYKKPTLAAFESYFTTQYYDNLSAYAVDIEETHISGARARVELVITRVATDPFSGEWSETGTVNLLQQGGQWKIESMPYQFWGWNWYGR
jgi:hypothetical protein